MRKSYGRLCLLAGALSIATPCNIWAQEFFRDYGTSRSSGGIGLVTPSDYSYSDTSPSGLQPLRPGQDLTVAEQTEENDKYNFAVGPIRFAIAIGFGIEFNDNITLSEHDRESDFILRPNIDFQATWRLSDLNTLHVNLGISYAKYLDHSEFDSRAPLISPNSDVALTFYTGSAVKWTVRDRISYQEDAYDIPVLSGVATYRRWENQAGLQGEWAINQNLSLTAGYDHYNLWTIGDDTFKDEDRAIDTFLIKPAVQISPGFKVGVIGSYSAISFSSSDRSDGNDIMVGPFIDWQLSDVTNLHLEGGYQRLHFDGVSSFDSSLIGQLGLSAADAAAVQGVLQDSSDSNSWYLKFEINNHPSDVFQHRLSFSKTAEIGFESDYYTIYHVEYNADWKCFPHTEFGPSLFYEHYTTSGGDSEHAYRLGAALGIRYHFTNSLTVGLDYRYLYKNSNLDDADYYQNLVFLSVYYKF